MSPLPRLIPPRSLDISQIYSADSTFYDPFLGGFFFVNVQLVRNNLIIATVKTSAADLVAQCVIERKPITEVDWKRNLATWLPG